MIAIKNILVGTDFSEVSAAALSYGRTLADQFAATLHIVHVVEDLATINVTADGFLAPMPELQKELEEAAQRRLDAILPPGPRPTMGRVITSNATAQAIVDYAKASRVDLIVTGTQGRTGLSRFLLGSVAERIVRCAPCPTLTVHYPEREFIRPDAPSAGAAA